MEIIIGADHRGYLLKEQLKGFLTDSGYKVVDVGAKVYNPDDDYVDFALKVAKRIARDSSSRGILLCGSGHGVDIVANRFSGVRSILGFRSEVVKQGRQHEDANLLSLPAEWVSADEAREMVEIFLRTESSGGTRYKRRLEKIRLIGRC